MTETSSTTGLQSQMFDYIVIGGGLAGLVLASRLSDDEKKSVLVVEAGANRIGDPAIDTPGLMTTLYDNPNYDWEFMSVPQPNVNNRQIACPRGRVLGGSSAINFSAIVYPSKANFDVWGKLGNDGWNGEDMAQYFRKFQNFHPPSAEISKTLKMDEVNEKAQGYGGPVDTCFVDGYGPFNEAWIKTFEALGYHLPGDPIEGEKIGAFTNTYSLDPKTKARVSSTAYYKGAAHRSNLRLLTEASVEKIVLEKSEDGSVIATGVQFVTEKDERMTVSAQKEVILCAGSIKSPQILELSGIGGKELLNKHGISVVIDNPQVGENLQDHPLSSMSFEVADDQVSGDILRDPNIFEAVLKLYKASGDGPLNGTPLNFAYLPLVDIDGALSSDQVEQFLEKYLDNVEYPWFPAQQLQYQLVRKELLNPKESSGEYMYLPVQLNVSASPEKTTMSILFSKITPGNYITIVTMINHPFSRGIVHIESSDPSKKPFYDPRYLSHPIDLEILARHTQYIEKLVSTEPFASLLKKNGHRIPSNADATDLESAKSIAKERLFTAFHPSGTCAMMPKEIGGVVDAKLRVHGTGNLRVVDASVFPIEPLGNIQSTVYAVAEKAADLIKEDWDSRSRQIVPREENRFHRRSLGTFPPKSSSQANSRTQFQFRQSSEKPFAG